MNASLRFARMSSDAHAAGVMQTYPTTRRSSAAQFAAVSMPSLSISTTPGVLQCTQRESHNTKSPAFAQTSFGPKSSTGSPACIGTKSRDISLPLARSQTCWCCLCEPGITQRPPDAGVASVKVTKPWTLTRQSLPGKKAFWSICHQEPSVFHSALPVQGRNTFPPSKETIKSSLCQMAANAALTPGSSRARQQNSECAKPKPPRMPLLCDGSQPA
mmetsp:Transcript_35701/g.66583  ORF Transcript_35701/g.66583 Transcript_35701/m.66583 type:complete len:216 (+) Transcript_35701:336-983(+)